APPAPRAVASNASAHTVQQPVDLRRDLDTLASALWVPSIGALDTGGAPRSRDVPGDGWNRRQRRAERAAGVGVALVAEVGADHPKLPSRDARRVMCQEVSSSAPLMRARPALVTRVTGVPSGFSRASRRCMSSYFP